MTFPPVLVYVHGGWHNSSCWTKVIVELQALGYPCHAVDLPSPQGITTDTSMIRSVLESYADQGKEIMIICHSIASRASCNASEGLDSLSRSKSGKLGGIRSICMIASFLVPNDARIGRDPNLPEITIDWMTIDGENCFVSSDNARRIFYNDLTESEAEYWSAQLRPVKFPHGNPTYDGWKHIPIYYLLCENDQAMPIASQEKMVNMARERGISITTERCKASHSPFLSMPEQVVGWIRRAAHES